MKKWYEMIVKAIEVTKQYTNDEVKQLSWLFSYLNNLDIDEEWFWTWVSAKWLWKLLNPLTRTWNSQPFREWWESVSNLSRLKENRDYEVKEVISKIPLNKQSFDLWENSQTSKDSLNNGNWLFDLEKVENKLSAVISYIQPKTRDDLKVLIIDFLNKEVKIIKAIWN